MMTLPEIVDRDEAPFVAIRRNVTLPFDDQIPQILSDLDAAVASVGAVVNGPVIYKHNIVDMPDLEMDFGVIVAGDAEPAADIVTGRLPAGRYAEITWFGPYSDLEAVNGVLIAWALRAGHRFDSEVRRDGEHFVCRLEIYHNSPDEEPDPARWKTTVSIKLRD